MPPLEARTERTRQPVELFAELNAIFQPDPKLGDFVNGCLQDSLAILVDHRKRLQEVAQNTEEYSETGTSSPMQRVQKACGLPKGSYCSAFTIGSFIPGSNEFDTLVLDRTTQGLLGKNLGKMLEEAHWQDVTGQENDHSDTVALIQTAFKGAELLVRKKILTKDQNGSHGPLSLHLLLNRKATQDVLGIPNPTPQPV